MGKISLSKKEAIAFQEYVFGLESLKESGGDYPLKPYTSDVAGVFEKLRKVGRVL